jgi:hypothetical protein
VVEGTPPPAEVEPSLVEGGLLAADELETVQS